jgi:plastocyanin
MNVSITLFAIAVISSVSCGQITRVYVNVFDFDFSINPPGEQIVDPVIQPGTEVVWAALDDFHNTISCAGNAEQWASEILFRNQSYAHIFTIPGTYWYYCSPHGFDNGDGTAGGMAGKITVLPAPSVASIVTTAAIFACRRRRT